MYFTLPCLTYATIFLKYCVCSIERAIQCRPVIISPSSNTYTGNWYKRGIASAMFVIPSSLLGIIRTRLLFMVSLFGEFCHQGQGRDTEIAQKIKIDEAYGHDHSLECSRGALSGGIF
jgi:hypothetical protein